MKDKMWISYTVTEEDQGMTVERIAREKLHVSGRMLQRLTRSKGIQLNRKNAFLARQVKKGDEVSVCVADPQKREVAKPVRKTEAAVEHSAAAALDILFEDEYFVVVNKPAGMMVHPVRAGQNETLVHALQEYYRKIGEEKTAHPVHRLDKETSGAILLATSSYAHQLADRMLREGEIERRYLAVVTGAVNQERGTIKEPIARDPNHPTKRRTSRNGDPAVTHYQVLARSDIATLVDVRLETGRTHQIRVHFQSLGHPLVGDTLYGGKRTDLYRQALHAHKLEFTHPLSGQKVACDAALPKDMQEMVHQLFPQQV